MATPNLLDWRVQRDGRNLVEAYTEFPFHTFTLTHAYGLYPPQRGHGSAIF